MARSITVLVVLAVAIGLGVAIGLAELRQGAVPLDWTMFAIMAGLLVFCEVVPRFWIRVGRVDVVTPSALFAFSLLLIGSPAAAVGITAVSSVAGSIVRHDGPYRAVVRAAGASAAVAAGGLVLRSCGIQGTITQHSTMPRVWGAFILLAGVTMIGIRTFITAIDDAVRSNVPFTTTLRRGVGARLTADGALLSLAPIWVIGVDFSPVLVPLLVVTTMLVFRSTRQAIEHAYDARHDPLTGLMNRRAFRDELSDACSGNGVGALLLMDLNGFKEINDQLGHEYGDRLLTGFGARLLGALPPGTQVARLGGDEFAAFLRLGPNGATDGRVDALTVDMHEALVKPLRIDGFPVAVGVSVGLALMPNHGRSASDLLRAADVAMYKAKRCGTAVERYDNCVQAPRRGRLGLLGELGTALAEHQLAVHFQPQLRLRDGHVDAMEALIRWHHPEHGSIPPSDFIGLAEQTELIGPITELVMRLAIDGVHWVGDASIRLAVNVSSRSLHDRYFAPHVFAVLADAGFPPDRLELEVTERALVTNPERSIYTIARLRETGVRIAIDDFGSGYSSYQTLRQLDVDRVKIDREFVAGVATNRRDREIVKSVIELAHQFGWDVVAEGVETTEVWNALGELGCDVAQGYAIARPMPFAEIRGWMNRWNELHVAPLVRQ